MQTSIDRSYRRAQKRRRIDSHPNIAHLLRHTAWLSWPLIHWRGRPAVHPWQDSAVVRTLPVLLQEKLRASPAGLYLMEPVDARSEETRLVALTGPRLGSATHALALVEHATRNAARPAPETCTLWRQMQSRLHVLGQCMDKWTQSARRLSARGQTLRQNAWTLDGLDVRPPLAVERVLGEFPEFSLPVAGQAVMEFALRRGDSHLPAFGEALRELLLECRLVDEEPARRRGILCSLLNGAMRTQPAFLPILHSASRHGQLMKWRANHAFAYEVVELFFQKFLPGSVRQLISAETRASFPFDQMCLWLVGVGLPPFRSRVFDSMPYSPDVSLPLMEVLGSLPSVTAATELEKEEFVGIAARCAALTGDPEVPRRFAVWLRACRHLARMTKNGNGVWQCANLRRWIVASRLEPDHLLRLSELLASRSVELFGEAWIKGATPAAAFWSLARLGGISRDDAIRIVDFGLIEIVHENFAGRPERLSDFMQFVTQYHRGWMGMEDWGRGCWVSLYAGMLSSTLPVRLGRWIEHLFVDRGFKFRDATCFIPELVEFLSMQAPGERASRESFLSEHLQLLDRILDEVELTLADLPGKGFDEWRSHARLWAHRFDICEILFQWERARLPYEASLVDTIFAWCRKRESRRIEDRQRVPWNLFNNVRGNEALVVRLSGGVVHRLVAFFDYHIERWNKPDHPFDGWLHLDRYPEVQSALRDLCRDPSQLRVVVRILRRLALALRLQCRTFLHARLEQWRSAGAQAAPLESLRAFGRLAGYHAPLPSAVERILDREQALRRERDTLAVMHGEGRASDLAVRRLAKLNRLLLDPRAIAQWVEKDARRMVGKLLPWVKVNILGLITREAVRAHWKGLLAGDADIEGRDWDNALHFFYSAERNKEVLRKLLRHTAERDTRWRLQHAPNAKFLAELRAGGFDAGAWLAPYHLHAQVHGESWTVKLEQDPLRVLQMGNLFGTCLSVDDCNAFAAIANAVEVNKQVLYLEGASGRVIGRKLIGLTPGGRLFGFRSYGAACLDEIDKPTKPEVWIKILFDLACLDLVRRAKGQFGQSAGADANADQLHLSADWYNDGPEDFDWWIAKPVLGEAVSRGAREPVAAAVLQHLELCGLDEDDRWDTAVETLRALLWLGDDAATIVERLGPASFAPNYLRYLRLQSPSENVRTLLGREPITG